MENASKALIMAASILLGIMILTIMVYVFREGSRIGANYDTKQAALSLMKYNQQFEDYIKDGVTYGQVYDFSLHAYVTKKYPYCSDNSIFDIITLFNLAYNCNSSFDFDDQNTVDIEVYSGSQKIFYIDGNDDTLGPNQVRDRSGNPIYVYNLAELSATKLNCASGVIDGNDLLSISEFRHNSVVPIDYVWYKYLFRNTSIEYGTTERVSKMIFEVYLNLDLGPGDDPELF